jgi:hypothetical protein
MTATSYSPDTISDRYTTPTTRSSYHCIACGFQPFSYLRCGKACCVQSLKAPVLLECPNVLAPSLAPRASCLRFNLPFGTIAALDQV